MMVRNPIVALLLALCLMLGAVSEAVARGEMAGMSDLVLCGGDGASVVTLDASGHKVQRHPCTQCLAAGHVGLLVAPVMTPGPVLSRAEPLTWAVPRVRLMASTLAALARGPPVFID
jgi:hypothetical protein